MAAQKNGLTEQTLDDHHRNWQLLISDLPVSLKERQDYLRTDNSEAVVAEHQRAFRNVKRVERRLEQYQKELDKILAILSSKEKMKRYCDLKRTEIREGVSSDVSGPLAKLRFSFDLAEKQAQPKLNVLLSVMEKGKTALSLWTEHLELVETVAWEQAVSLPEEDQQASQVAADQRRKAVTETEEAAMSGKVAIKIAKKHNYPDEDITAVCIAVACKRDRITGRTEIARKLKKGARNYYRSAKRSRLVEWSWLLTGKGKTGFASHTHRLRKKAESPKYEAPDGTSMADSIRKDYKLPQK